MGISAPGVGSNLDINGIISKLMQVESQPLGVLAKKEAGFQAQVSAYGKLNSALSTFQTALKGLSDVSKFQQQCARCGQRHWWQHRGGRQVPDRSRPIGPGAFRGYRWCGFSKRCIDRA